MGRGHWSQVVVGAAVVDRGRLLAARRRGVGPSAGRWELPGGKVESGEPDEAALVREVREELGVEVTLGLQVLTEAGATDWPLPGIGVLRVWTARLRGAGQPRPLTDHDELRWLGRTEAFDVAWLPADRPVVEQLLIGPGLWPPDSA